MKIQFLNGGLANQAFQYIFARYYELSHPGEQMYMDDSYFALNTVHTRKCGSSSWRNGSRARASPRFYVRTASRHI